MDSGILYLIGSGSLAAVSLIYMHSQLNHTPQNERDITIALAANLPLFPSVSLVLFNFLLSIISCMYSLLRFTFFGRISSVTTTERQRIVEKLFAFFSFKFVLIGLIVEPGIVDMIVWIYWCANLALTKAIIQHGLLQAAHLANASASPRQYIRPASHIIFVILFCLAACKSYGVYVSDRYPHAFWSLFLFDLVTLLVEMMQSSAIYMIYITNALQCKLFSDPVEKACLVHVVADIVLLHVTLLHFMYVSIINGLTLSLVDVLLFLNIRSTFSQLFKKVNELRALLATRTSIDNLFPTCDIARYKHDTSDDNCPICLGSLEKTKKLPCGHHIHADCLMQLMRRATFARKSDLAYITTRTTEDIPSNTDNANMSHTNETTPAYRDSGGGFAGTMYTLTSSVNRQNQKSTLIFPCPLCRKNVDLYTGALVEKLDTSGEGQHQSNSALRTNTEASTHVAATNDHDSTNLSYMDTFFGSIRTYIYGESNENRDGLSVDPRTMINMLSEIFPQYSYDQLEEAVRNRFSNWNMSQIIDELLVNPLEAVDNQNFPPPPASSPSSSTMMSGSEDGLYRLVGTFVDSTDEIRVDQQEHDEFYSREIIDQDNDDYDYAATVAPGAFHGTGRPRRRNFGHNNDVPDGRSDHNRNDFSVDDNNGYWITSIFGSR